MGRNSIEKWHNKLCLQSKMTFLEVNIKTMANKNARATNTSMVWKHKIQEVYYSDKVSEGSVSIDDNAHCILMNLKNKEAKVNGLSL